MCARWIRVWKIFKLNLKCRADCECGQSKGLQFPLPLPLHLRLQFILQLVFNRARAEFMEFIRGVIFYRAPYITYSNFTCSSSYMACLCVCTIAHTPRGPAMHSDKKTDKTDMLAGKYQFQYQFRLPIQLQFQFLFRLWPPPTRGCSLAAKKVRKLHLP